NGRVYVSYVDAQSGEVYADSARDGVHFGADRLVATYSLYSSSCFAFGTSIPAQPRRCVTPNPTLAVDATGGPRSGRVYLTFGNTGANSALDVYERVLDARLRPLPGFAAPRRVNRPDGVRRSDQFWPASALDQTTGDLWICFYDTRE